METPQNNPGWEDVVFKDRNHEYGAYVLRKTYTRNLLRAGMGTVLLLGLSYTAPVLAGFFGSDNVNDAEKKTQTIELGPPPEIEVKPPQVRVVLPPPARTLAYVAPKLTPDEIEDEIPTMEEIRNVQTSTETTEGPETVVMTEPVAEVVTEAEDNSVHSFVEQIPEFPGGVKAMAEFIKRNLKYPRRAQQMGTEGKVFVEFVVNKDGSISNVATMRGISADCDQEASRVVSIMPSWSPGKQNGKAVRVKYVVPINYMISSN